MSIRQNARSKHCPPPRPRGGVDAGRRTRPNRRVTAKHPLIIDLDATLVTAHSEREDARATSKNGFGSPLLAFADHGPDRGEEMLTCLLRPDNAGSNTAAGHKTVIRQALTQVGMGARPGKKVLTRIDGAESTKETIEELVKRRVWSSVGYTLPASTPELYRIIPEHPGAGLRPRRHPTPGRGRGRADRPTGPRRVARGDAGHRPLRTTAPRRAAAVRGRRRLPPDHLRGQHQ